MEFLGIGVPELVFAVLIALIVLGPRDMVKAGRTIGRYLNRLVRSETWRSIQYMWRETRTLPNKLMREAGMEDIAQMGKNIQTEIRSDLKVDAMSKDLREWRSDITDWTSPVASSPPPIEPVIAPPDATIDESTSENQNKPTNNN